jgi:uncharacterized damage-inducible protein DinB
MNEPLAAMFRYNHWATMTLLEWCRGLSDEQLDVRGSGTSGTVRELLVHIVGGQQSQALRTKGRHHEGEYYRHSAWPGWDELLENARASGEELIAIAEALEQDRDVDLPYQGRVSRIPASFFLVHAMEMLVEHRTEVRVALESVGLRPPSLDGWDYAASVGIGRDVT